MTVVRRPQIQPDSPVVSLKNVSRAYDKQREYNRSLQQRLLRIITRKQRTSTDLFYPLQDVSLSIHSGDFLGIIGPNGAGKSTLLKLVTGIIVPTSGDLTVCGRVCSLLELGAGFHPDLTGRENIYLNGSIYGLNRREIDERIERIIDFAELGDFIDTPVKHYSSGMYVRLGFSVAIHTDPDILLVDEVLAVGDVNFQQKCLRSIENFRKRGGTLILVSHDLSTLQSICTRAIWLEDGRIQADGNPLDVGMAYLESMANREQTETSPVKTEEDSRRWGTGRIRITDVEMYRTNGQIGGYFYTGEPVRIRVKFESDEAVTSPVFGIAIHHQNGTHITGPNTAHAGIELGTIHGRGWIDYIVPQLPLLEGVYTVSAAVVNHNDTETYDYRDRICKFRVLSSRTPERYGLVVFGGHWQLETSAESAAPNHDHRLSPDSLRSSTVIPNA